MTKKRLEEILKGSKAIYPLHINGSPDVSNFEYHVMSLSCRNAATHGDYVNFEIYEIKAIETTLGYGIRPVLHQGVIKNGVEVMPENGWTTKKVIDYLYNYFKEEDF